jgi:SAM-dependent methyltransferase
MKDKKLSRVEVISANREAWNLSAPLHHGNDAWREMVETFTARKFDILDDTITEVLTRVGVNGKSAVQICCNNGWETICLGAMGASRCLGIDQSAGFIDQARELNTIAGQDCEFLVADVYELPEDLNESFDLAFITIGVFGWMPDLPAFFQVVARLLRPGGSLVIYETHPFLEMFEPHCAEPMKPHYSYFDNSSALETDPIVYDGSQPDTKVTSYWHVHKAGDIINAAIGAGMVVEEFNEYAHSVREVDFDIYLEQEAQMPLCFSLVARKSA